MDFIPEDEKNILGMNVREIQLAHLILFFI